MDGKIPSSNLSLKRQALEITSESSSPMVWVDSPAEEELSLGQAWSIIKHRSLLILGMAMGITALAAAWTLQKTPVYEGNFQLLVGEPIAVNNQSKPTILEGLGAGQIDYDTQIEVLKSRSILEPIINTLSKKYPNLKYEKLVGTVDAPLQIEQIENTKILKINLEDSDPDKIKFILESLAQAYLKYSLDERKVEINQGMNFVSQQIPQLQNVVNQHQTKLQQFRQKYNLIDPNQKAQELTTQLNTLETQYFDTRVQLGETQSLYETLQKQVGLSVEGAISSSYLSDAPRYQALLNRLQEIELELNKESARFSDENPIIQTLKEERDSLLPLVEKEAQNALGKRNSEQLRQSPALGSPSALRLTLNQQYVQAENELKQLKFRENSLASEINILKQQIKQLPLLSRQYTELERELRIASESLERLLEAQQKLQIDGAQQTLPWQLISKPVVAEDPLYPIPIKNISLGLLAGLSLGVLAAFLAEKLDPVFHSLGEMKEKTKLPLLGMIPWQKELKSLNGALDRSLSTLQIGNRNLSLNLTDAGGDKYYKVSGFLEAFRSLNTNIWLLGTERSYNSFVVSSTSPEDGKTTVSVNLAQAAAAMGQRVLLVDADLRRPQVHHLLGIANGQGLSNVIATGLDIAEAIQPIPQWENLSILTAGDIPPDPTRLLASQRMRQIVEHLGQREDFDLIIYDTPPLANFADSRILGSLTSGIVMVIRVNKTDRAIVKHVIDDLKMASVPLLGLVANGIQQGSLSNYNPYYYYRR